MAIITDIQRDGSYWVSVILGSTNTEHYESLGYDIPRSKNKYGHITIPLKTEILVRIEHLSKRSVARVTKVCDKCYKHVNNQRYQAIMRQRIKNEGVDRCSDCGRTGRKRENVKYEKSLEYYALNNDKHYLLKEFSDKNDRHPSKISYGSGDQFVWDCPECTSEYISSAMCRTRSDGCPYCRGMQVNSTNSIWTTHPDVAKLLKHPDNGHSLTSGSHKKETFVCPNCFNEVEDKIIKDVVKRGLSCTRCSDGVSYPEKFINNLLSQLKINFMTQKSFDWSQGRRYDFYIETHSCIIETHGGQHYHNVGFGRTLLEEQNNDELKERLARENKIENYFIINCSQSDAEFIKNNILNNKELSNLFDFRLINWLSCHKFACNSTKLKIICELWNAGETIINIGKKINLEKSAVVKYLKTGAKLDLCDYNAQISKKRRCHPGNSVHPKW